MNTNIVERLYEEAQDNPDSLEWKAANLIEQLQRENERNQLDNASLSNQLAAAQLENRTLREALTMVRPKCDMKYAIPIVDQALSTPTDTSALDRMIAEEREACAKVRVD